MRTGTFARATALSGAALLALTACGGSSDAGDGGGDASGEKQVKIYGTDGNMGNALGADFDQSGSLAGMKGTAPLTELSSDFTDRLLTINPALEDFNYSAESYDAVLLTALAAQSAGTNQATVWGPYVNALTYGGEKCDDYASCLEILNSGGDVDYDGVSGPLAFTDAGEPAYASFGLLQFGDDNTLDESKTEFVFGGDEANASGAPGPAPVAPGATGAPLVIGTLLPETGNLAFLGPPEIAGVQLAINEINKAGGTLGGDVQLVTGDSGDTSTDTATGTVDRLLQSSVNAIIGAASSSVSLTVIDTIVNAGVAMLSPANTSDQFTTYDDKGLYFRTAPPDVLQARALADVMGQDGVNTVGILALNDSYGTGLAGNLKANLISDGLTEDNIRDIIYDPQAANFDSEVQQMAEFTPDAIVVIGFEESSRIISALNAQGIGPQR
jgi:ABC-type branched-subunit amino acid transport system substrate-binding protein